MMETVAPLGSVYQAGTLSGNPVAMAAGVCMLRLIRQNPGLYAMLDQNGDYFFTALAEIIRKAGLHYQVNHIGSLGCLFFTQEKPTDSRSAKTSDTKAYGAYCRYMLRHGVYLAPAQFEAMFLSAAHTKELLDRTLEVAEGYFA